MSYATYVDDGSGFACNALRFETAGEARSYGHDLFKRWLALRGYEAREVEGPVTHAWVSGDGLVDVRIEEG